MMEHYGIPAFKDANEFLTHVAKTRGIKRPDFVADLKVTARMVLKGWKSGSVRFYQEPPELPSLPQETEAQFVQDWGKELDINSIINVNVEHASTEIESTVRVPHKRYCVLKPLTAEKMEVED